MTTSSRCPQLVLPTVVAIVAALAYGQATLSSGAPRDRAAPGVKPRAEAVMHRLWSWHRLPRRPRASRPAPTADVARGVPPGASGVVDDPVGVRAARLALQHDGASGAAAFGRGDGEAHVDARRFVNLAVREASGGRFFPTAPASVFVGAVRVPRAAATLGDLIQDGVDGHSAVVLRPDPDDDAFLVVDCDFTGDGEVGVHVWRPGDAATFWRYPQPSRA